MRKLGGLRWLGQVGRVRQVGRGENFELGIAKLFTIFAP